jgi:hypothetical protein
MGRHEAAANLVCYDALPSQLLSKVCSCTHGISHSKQCRMELQRYQHASAAM